MSHRDALMSLDRVESLILSIRRRRLILDLDLIRLYGVTTAKLNEQVKWNQDRFPPDFMLALTREHARAGRLEGRTPRADRMGLRHPRMAFTEQGVAMVSS